MGARGRVLLVACLVASGCSQTDVQENTTEIVEGDSSQSAATTNQVAFSEPESAFFASIDALCGQAFAGRVVASVPPDPSFDDQAIAMHVRQCSNDEIRIPFFVGEDRSRTWVITPTETGLRLKHDHRHEDGSEDDVTQYGGDTRGDGTAMSQDFHADAFTGELVPAAANNVWTVEIRPGETFVYALRREGSDRRFRVEFDLTIPIERPPPPWGANPIAEVNE